MVNGDYLAAYYQHFMRFQVSCGAMDQNMKPVLDEFADLDFARVARDIIVDQCFTALETARVACDIAIVEQCLLVLDLIHVEHIKPEHDDRVTAREAAATDMGPWRLEIKALLDDLKLTVSMTSNSDAEPEADALPAFGNQLWSPEIMCIVVVKGLGPNGV